MITGAAGRRSGLAIVCTCIVVLPLVQTLALPARAYPRPGSLERIDVSTSGDSVQGGCGHNSSVSAGGRHIAFDTDAPLADGDTNQEVDVYLRDRKRGTTELISVGINGSPAIGPPDQPGCSGLSQSWDPSITPDGRYIAFSSFAVNLVEGDANGLSDVFVYDRKRQLMERVSVNSRGEQTRPDRLCPASGCDGGVGGHSSRPSISADGRRISITSTASNLVPNDKNEFADVFVHDRRSGKTIRVSVDSEGHESSPCTRSWYSYQCYLTWGDLPSSISLNGRYVAFHSRSPDLVADDTNGIYDVFVHDLQTRRTERVSVATDSTEAQDLQGNRAAGMSGWSGSTVTGGSLWDAARVISADGRFVAFVSTATNLVPNDTNRSGAASAYLFASGGDTFVHDRKTGRTERVSVTSDGREQNRCGELTLCYTTQPSISADGRYVGFLCMGGCELSRNVERDSAVAVFDRQTGALVHAPMTEHGDGTFPGQLDLSASGQHVSFASHYWYDDEAGSVVGSGIAFYLFDRGPPLGPGFYGKREKPGPKTSDEDICIPQVVCIPPGGALFRPTTSGDVYGGATTPEGADIIATRLAYRPRSGDIYLRLDVSQMPAVRGTPVVGDPPVTYGFRIDVEGAAYELRAALAGGAALQPAFGLFRCDGDSCIEVAHLEGGYGTAGDDIVVSLPLSLVGLEKGGRISSLTAFTAIGSYLSGNLATLDEVELGS